MNTTSSSSDKKTEVELVSQRVAKTKYEIEQLKMQLERLIKEGINKTDYAERSTENKTNAYNEIPENLSEIKENSNVDVIKSKTFKDNVADIIGSISNEDYKPVSPHFKILVKEKHKSPIKQQTEKVKKVKHYDQKETREYMKKQRERRKELMKNKKNEIGFTADIKKQRLEELRKKSLELVSKNIQNKRERSRSREANDHPIKKYAGILHSTNNKIQVIIPYSPVKKSDAADSVPDLKVVDSKVSNIITKQESNSSLNRKKSGRFIHPQFKNVTIRSSDIEDLRAIPKLDVPQLITTDSSPSLEKQHKAAVKIQSAFRGYQQKKLFKLTLLAKSQSKEKTFSKEVQTSVSEKEIPAWLQTPIIKPYPYNFINAVKRKLNLVIQQASATKTNDVVVQNSPTALQFDESQVQEDIIQKTLPVKISDATVQISPTVPRLINESQIQKNAIQQTSPVKFNDTAIQNLPIVPHFNELPVEKNNKSMDKIKSESLSSHKNSDLRSFLSHKCLELDMKAVEPLVLTRKSTEKENNHLKSIISIKTEIASDSDTSKNIPEISSESSIAITSKEIHSAKHSRDSDPNHDDIKLSINTEKVKNLKLRKPKPISTADLHNLNFSNNSKSQYTLKWTEETSEHIINSEKQIKSKCFSKLPDKSSEIHTDPNTSQINSKERDPSEKVTSQYATDFEHHIKSKNSSKSHSSEILTDPVESKIYSKEIYLSGRDSIITSNKCNYSGGGSKVYSINNGIVSTSELSRNKSLASSSQEHISKTKSDPILTTVSSNTANQENTLHSFQTYMRDLKDEKQNLQEKIQNKNSKSESYQSTNVIWKKTLENKENLEKSQSTHKNNLEKRLKNTEITTNINSIKTASSTTNPQEYSSNFSSFVSSVPSLKRPSISLKSSLRVSSSEDTDVTDDKKTVTNITLKSGKKSAVERKIKSNEIHLKFEAELHLLNEFNDSLRQVMAVEKSLVELQNNKITNDNKATTTYHTQDTQTSLVCKTATNSKTVTNTQNIPTIGNGSKTQSQIPGINYSRGSDVIEPTDTLSLKSSIMEADDPSCITTGLELSQIKENSLTSSIEESNVDVSVVKENLYDGNIYAGLSLDMFERLIKDEDARIENLKTLLKIREKALVDRTKGELAWLEIQKRHLRDSGQLQEISAIKKKQRGLLIKLEHERYEMQRLKQVQKAASRERKSVLKEQRNMIKAQLSTNNMITKIKRNTKDGRRHSGPLKVYNIRSCSESIISETSLSRRSSATEEVVSVVSHSHSIVSHVAEEIVPAEKLQKINSHISIVPSTSQIKTEYVKRSLLMRQAALQKRRKAAEELLQWHQRLVEEEGKITELELAANTIINQIPTVTNSMNSDDPTVEKHKFKGSQLNLLWHNMTGREEKKFNDQVTYTMSKTTLERFCKDAKKHALGKSRSFNKKSVKHSDGVDYINVVSQNILSDSTLAESVHSTLSKSSSDEKLRKHSKSSKSSSFVRTEIPSYQNNSVSKIEESLSKQLTKLTKDDSQVTDYSSDFESVTKDSTEMQISESPNNERTSTRLFVNDKDQTEINDVSFKEQSIVDKPHLNGDLHDEFSVSENEDEINAITEISKTDEDRSSSSKPTEIINDTSSSNKLSPIDTIKSASEEDRSSSNKPTEIINDTSSSIKLSLIDTIKSASEEDSSSSNKPTEIINDTSSSIKLSPTDTIKTTSKIIYPSDTAEIHKENLSLNELSTVDSNIIKEANLDKQSDSGSVPENFSLENSTSANVSHSNVQKHVIKSKNSNSSSSKIHIVDPGLVSTDFVFDEKTDIDDVLSDTGSNTTQTENEELVKDVENIIEESSQIIKSSEKLSETNESNTFYSQNDNDLSELKTSVPDGPEHVTAETIRSESDNNSGEHKIACIIIDDPEEQSKISVDLSESESEILEEQSKLTAGLDVVENESEGPLHSKVSDDQPPNTINEDQLLIRTTDNHIPSEIEQQSNDEVLEMSCQDTTIYEELSVDMSVHNASLSMDSVNSKAEGKQSKSNSGIDTIKTSKISSNIEEPQSKKIDEQETEISSGSISTKPEHDIIGSATQTNKNNVEVDTENSITSTTSKKTESPVLLSYGCIAEKGPTSAEKESDELSSKSSLDSENSEQVKSNASSQHIEISENNKDALSDSSTSYEVKPEFKQTIGNTEEVENSPSSNLEDIMFTVENPSSESLKSEDHIKQISKDDPEIAQKIKSSECKKIESSDMTNNSKIQTKPNEVEHLDVKKRVLEILADANIPSPRGDKSPRLQDLYITAYDVASPNISPELGSPNDENEQNVTSTQPMYGTDEVEELLKKQLAIEQEIKEIQQQQKVQLPYLILREIPNKPPPPYTPPISTQTSISGSVLPCSENQISLITNTAADILHNAYLNKNLQNVTVTEEIKNMLSKSNIEKICFEFVFDMCKEAAIVHYKQFDTETGPSWLQLRKKSKLAIGKPLDRDGLEKFINKKIGQFLGYETVKSAENIKRKWCGKKRDHVDDLLVVECQAEEAEWTNYDKDELLVKDELTKDILNMLTSETAQIFNNILRKKAYLC